MAKKSRKARAKLRIGQQEAVFQSNAPSSASTQIVQPLTKSGISTAGALAIQAGKHQHVVPELIRICIIAGALFVIIIVLSFFIS